MENEVPASPESVPQVQPEPSTNRRAFGKVLKIVIASLCALLLASVLFLGFTLVNDASKVQKAVSRVPVWEYKTVDYFPSPSNERTGTAALKYNTIEVSQSEINQLGQEGWELVTSYLETETSYPNFGNSDYVTGIQPNVRPQKLVLIFKRELPAKI